MDVALKGFNTAQLPDEIHRQVKLCQPFTAWWEKGKENKAQKVTQVVKRVQWHITEVTSAGIGSLFTNCTANQGWGGEAGGGGVQEGGDICMTVADSC